MSAQTIVPRRRKSFNRFLGRMRRHKLATAGASGLLFVALVALIGPLISDSATAVDAMNRLQKPSAEHWFGTDGYGRDVFARVVEGAKISLSVGAMTAAFSTLIGCAIGLYAAYSRIADAILMRICDGLMAFPGILLAIALMAALGQNTANVVIALTVVFSPYVARIVRSSALVVKEQTFIEALRSQGASSWRILWKNIAPNVVSPLIVQATFIFADSIITEAALSFLGAGVPPPNPSWGNILLEGKDFIYVSWWMTLFPGLFIVLTILSMNLLGDGLRDLLDPTYRGPAIGTKQKKKPRPVKPAGAEGQLSAGQAPNKRLPSDHRGCVS